MNPKFTLSSDLYIVCHQILLITLVTLHRTAKLCRLPLLRATNSHHKKCDTCSFSTKYTVSKSLYLCTIHWVIFRKFLEGGREGEGGTVPQEGHNFVFPRIGFFHLFSLFEGKIWIFWGKMELGTIFFRIYSDFKKKRAKKVGKCCILLELPKNVIFGFKYLKYEIYSKNNI